MTARWIQVLGLCLGMFFPSLALAELAAKPLPPAPAVWAAALAEPLPPALAQALAGKVRFVEAGPIQKAAEQVVATRAALASLRCSEVMPSLRKAGEALLDEVPSFLSYQTEPLPTDLALLLPRYLHATAFGPPRAPVRVESDPSGATVIRNAQVIGKTPLLIDGGRPDLDVVYVELPGMRKVRRPLGAARWGACGERVLGGAGVRPGAAHLADPDGRGRDRSGTGPSRNPGRTAGRHGSESGGSRGGPLGPR